MPTSSKINHRLLSALRDMFGTFCLELFEHKRTIVNTDQNVDHIAIHKAVKARIKMYQDDEKNTLSRRDVDDVIYIMCAMADEIFLNMEWNGKEYWENNMLEQEFFNTQFAGESIFQKLEELLNENEPVSLEKAEIYLKALSLGFKGKYRGLDCEQKEINAIREKLYYFIGGIDKSIFASEYRIFQREYTFTIPTMHRQMMPDASIINYVIVFFIFMFLVISSVVWVFETRDIGYLLREICTITMRE
jgi:type IV/VI secretion system ImpK/VasF family protein